MIASPDKQIVEWLQVIQPTCQRSIDLIVSFVNLEFLESASIVINKERLDVVWEIGQMVDSYQKSEKAIAKVFEFSFSHEHIYTQIDSMKFLQVINNLLSNAINFTQDNGLIQLHVEQKQATGTMPGVVLISVRDIGIGIPVEYHTGLFGKFTKARRHSLKGEEPVGLGMSIIKTIVVLHGGRIWFESEENTGTTFFIELLQQ
jgi:two-component system sensor histidine kinase VicK